MSKIDFRKHFWKTEIFVYIYILTIFLLKDQPEYILTNFLLKETGIISGYYMTEEIAGFASGTVQTLVGHPLDTLKVWKQRNIKPNISQLFRGIRYPLLTGTFVTTGQFASYNWFNKYSESDVMCGAFSGIFSGLVLSPIDKYKISDQTMGHYTSRYGLASCLLREIPANAIYFGTYSYSRENNIDVLSSGAIAGASSWLITYPFDIIKTQVQSGELDTKTAILQMIQRKTLVTSGLGFCLIRAVIVNSIGFYVYETFRDKPLVIRDKPLVIRDKPLVIRDKPLVK
jgi:hypothetical protein